MNAMLEPSTALTSVQRRMAADPAAGATAVVGEALGVMRGFSAARQCPCRGAARPGGDGAARWADAPRQPRLSRRGHNRSPMRKLLLAFLLPFVVLLSQQGAVTHEIGHIADFVARAGGEVPASVQNRNGHLAGDLQCEACLAFAHLSGMATVQVLAPALLSFSFHFSVIEAPAFIAADAPSARSRGPPAVL
jgi:hypothetical protein